LKICVTASEKSLEAQMDPRFGRCRYFIIVDPETGEFEALDNMAISAPHGAGIQSAQTLVNKGVEAVITGYVGPNAYRFLTAAGVKVITGVTGTVREVVERYRRGSLQPTAGSVAPTHYGAGVGLKWGMGFGRRMGRGGWWSPGPTVGPPTPPPVTPLQETYPRQASTLQKPEEELRALQEYKKRLEEDLEGVKARIKELKDLVKVGPEEK